MHYRLSLPTLLALLLGLACAALWRPAPAQTGPNLEPNQPVLLVANPQLGEMYAHTVLVAIPLGENRHAGLIINRPTTSPPLIPSTKKPRICTTLMHLAGAPGQ